MPIPNRFAIAPPIQVNYDFTDVITNQSFIVLYAHTDKAGNTTLIRQPIDSHNEAYEQKYNGGATGDVKEVNYDYQFKVPQKVEGTLYTRIVFFARATATQTVDCTIKCRVIHWDGSTETEIAAQQTSQTISQTADSATLWNMVTFAFTVDKQFKIDEKLRIEVIIATTTGTNAEMGFLNDPANKDFGQLISNVDPAPSDFIVYAPINPVQ